MQDLEDGKLLEKKFGVPNPRSVLGKLQIVLGDIVKDAEEFVKIAEVVGYANKASEDCAGGTVAMEMGNVDRFRILIANCRGQVHCVFKCLYSPAVVKALQQEQLKVLRERVQQALSLLHWFNDTTETKAVMRCLGQILRCDSPC